MSTMLSLIKSFLSLLLALFRYLFYRAITSFLTGLVLLFVAVLMFITFHQAYMPVVSHVKPVYLQFSSECQDTSAGLCSYPEASVYFTSKNKANDERMLMRGQSYKVFLDIEMPSSPKNEKLGMFMVNVKFLSAKGTVLKTSSRSCMLHYESNLVRLFRTIFYSLPLTLGLTEEKQKVEINFFEDYIDDSYNPSVQAKVVILTRQVEIYSSTLRLQASFTGLRYVIFNWPYLFSCLAVFGNFITLTLIYSACVNQLYSSPSTTTITQQQTTQPTNSLQQNGIIANSSGTRPAATLINNDDEAQQSTPMENEISDNLTPQEENQLPQTMPSAMSKLRNRQTQRISLSQLKLPRKRLKIKNRKTIKIEIGNQQESVCNGIDYLSNNVQCLSSQDSIIDEPKFDDQSDFASNSRHHKNTSNNENKNYKMEINGKKNGSRKLLSGSPKKLGSKSLARKTNCETGSSSCKVPAEPPVEMKWEAMNLPRVQRLGGYLEDNIPVFTKRLRHCISDLELSTFEENRFHVMPRNCPKKSASTSDLRYS